MRERWFDFVERANPFTKIRIWAGLLSILVTASLTLILSLIAGNIARAQLETKIGEQLDQTAYEMIYTLDSDLFERYREIQIIASLDVIRDTTTPLSEKRALLNVLQETYVYYTWIGIANTDGTVLVGTNSVLEGVDASARPWFVDGSRELYLGERHEAVLLANVLYADSDLPIYFVDIATPLIDSITGEVTGVLVAHINWEWVQAVRSEMLPRAYQQDDVEVFILNSRYETLVDPGDEELPAFEAPPALVNHLKTNTNGFFVESESDYIIGFAKSTGYENFPGYNWTIVVRQPLMTAFTLARALETQIFSLGLLIGVIFAAISWKASGLLVKPVVSLTQATSAILQGDQNTHIPVIRGKNEVAKLSLMLNNLMRDLGEQTIAREQFEQKVAELSNQLEEEREAIRLREGFISVVAHEFRNPLAALVSSSMLMTRYYDRMDAIKRAEHAERIDQLARYLNDMLEDMLTYNRARNGLLRFAPQPTEFTTVCGRILDEVIRVDDGKHQFIYDVQGNIGTVYTDLSLLQHILGNLLNNAVKYSPQDSTIRFQISRAEHDSTVILKVTDEGIGIPDEELARLFEPFFRANNVKEIGGTGLGLAIVKQAVESHGGSITVASRAEIGTTFTIILPCDARQIGVASV